MEVINTIGRRKSSVARIYLSEGTGKITINKKDITEFFPSAILQYVVKQPLQLLGVEGQYDIKVNLYGGGFTGQSQALRLAIARALVEINPEDKKNLKDHGFLTRDSRAVERKKPGQPKARAHSLPVQQALIFSVDFAHWSLCVISNCWPQCRPQADSEAGLKWQSLGRMV